MTDTKEYFFHLNSNCKIELRQLSMQETDTIETLLQPQILRFLNGQDLEIRGIPSNKNSR